MAKKKRAIKCRAIRLEQGGISPLYMFSLTGKQLLEISDISRISRTKAGKLLGYQRPAVKKHIKDIVAYLDSGNVTFPNPIILSLDATVKFVASRGPRVGDKHVISGALVISLPGEGEKKPAWIVDGQQRALAISMSKRQELAVPVNAFIAEDISLQRDQFLRINNSKPLPRGLITELLPNISGPLPEKLSASKIPSALCDLLNQRKQSPFYGLIRRASTDNAMKKKAVITDTSVIKMLTESINSPSGCLFPYRNIASGETDFEGIWQVLAAYWTAVKNTFPEAWGKDPSRSRLMHGAGMRSMGRLMDRIMPTIDVSRPGAVRNVEKELRRIAHFCRWTSGAWEEIGNMRWDEIQNVPRHISVLSNYVVRKYIAVAAKGR